MTENAASALYSAFQGHARLAHGDLATVLRAVAAAAGSGAPTLILDDRTGDRIEPDPRESIEDTAARYAEPIAPPAATSGRGRPRLGVTAKEVTLLPRHWDWLQQQPGGASAALRRLVEAARRDGSAADNARRSQRALDRFLYLVCGDLPDFEEAYRAFYAADLDRFAATTGAWPTDLRDHARALFAAWLDQRARTGA